MTRVDQREPIIYPELNLRQRPSNLNHADIRRQLLSLLQWLCILLYGLTYAYAAVTTNVIPAAWSWTILAAIYPPFIIFAFCDTSCRKRRNWDGTTEKRTGWPFRIALV